MKFKGCIILVIFVILLAGCSPSVETITGQPGNYLYSENEGK